MIFIALLLTLLSISVFAIIGGLAFTRDALLAFGYGVFALFAVVLLILGLVSVWVQVLS